MKCRVLQHRPSVPPTSIRTSQCHAMQPWGPLCCDGAYWSLTQPLPWVFRGPLSLATQGSGLCQVHHPVLTEGARGQLRPRAGGKGGGGCASVFSPVERTIAASCGRRTCTHCEGRTVLIRRMRATTVPLRVSFLANRPRPFPGDARTLVCGSRWSISITHAPILSRAQLSKVAM